MSNALAPAPRRPMIARLVVLAGHCGRQVRRLVVFTLCMSPAFAFAERAVNDLLSYEPPPAGWTKEVKAKHYTSYGTVNGREYCQIFVLPGTNSKGDISADFNTEWQALIVGNYRVTSAPTLTESEAELGWKVKAGVATFAYGGVSMAMLTTVSGYGRTASIVALTNSQAYAPAIQDLLASVKMNKVTGTAQPATTGTQPGAAAAAQPAALQGYMEYNIFTKSYTWRLRYPPPQK